MYDTTNVDGLFRERQQIKGETLYIRSEMSEYEREDEENRRVYDIKITYDGLKIDHLRVTHVEVRWNEDRESQYYTFYEDEEKVFKVTIMYGDNGEEDTTLIFSDGDNTMAQWVRNVEYDKAISLRFDDTVAYSDREETKE